MSFEEIVDGRKIDDGQISIAIAHPEHFALKIIKVPISV